MIHKPPNRNKVPWIVGRLARTANLFDSYRSEHRRIAVKVTRATLDQLVLVRSRSGSSLRLRFYRFSSHPFPDRALRIPLERAWCLGHGLLTLPQDPHRRCPAHDPDALVLLQVEQVLVAGGDPPSPDGQRALYDPIFVRVLFDNLDRPRRRDGRGVTQQVGDEAFDLLLVEPEPGVAQHPLKLREQLGRDRQPQFSGPAPFVKLVLRPPPAYRRDQDVGVEDYRFFRAHRTASSTSSRVIPRSSNRSATRAASASKSSSEVTIRPLRTTRSSPLGSRTR